MMHEFIYDIRCVSVYMIQYIYTPMITIYHNLTYVSRFKYLSSFMNLSIYESVFRVYIGCI